MGTHHSIYGSSSWPARSALALAIIVSITGASSALAETQTETVFDVQAMKARGVDPNLATWFKTSKFMPGVTTVSIVVNGSERGKFDARFDNDGQLCADAAFQKAAGLVSPPGFSEKNTCFDLRTAWPRAELNLDPGEGKINLVVPAEALASAGEGNWQHGGKAGMLNYDAQYMDSAGSSSGTQYAQLDTEGGFNIHDWIVRSRQTFSRLDGENTIQHQNAYAQRSFAGVKKVLQAGQINLSNSMFGAGQVYGVQMFPEAALQGANQGAGIVEGIADTQSVVEVRQSGVLIYSTTVPAGPFTLKGFSLLNMRTDLAVTMTSSNGDKRQFTVPAGTFLNNGPLISPGLSFGAGKLDQDGSDESPLLGTVAKGWVLSPRTLLNSGFIGSSVYQAGAVSLDTQPFNATQLSLQTTLAQDSKHRSSGASVTASVNHALTETLSVNFNVTQQSQGYRELNDAVQKDDQDTQGRSRNQYGAGISWSEKTLGSLSLALNQSTTFRGEQTSYVTGSWSHQIGRAYVGASIQHTSATNDYAAEDRYYLTLSIPLGNSSISSYINSGKNGARAGMRYNNRSSQDRGWGVSSERNFRDGLNSFTGSMDRVTPVSQLSGSVTHDSDNANSWTGRASGSVVAHDHGVTLSPYRVGDTFGIAKVGDEAGVKLDTPAGPAWTDRRGYAVLPGLNGYRHASVQLDTRTLAKNVDITNAWQETDVARGAVSEVNFDVVRTRRVLVTLRDPQGKVAPHGASVFNADNQFLTVVGEDGAVFIPDARSGEKLDVQVSGNPLCSFSMKLPEKADATVLFETASSVCS